MSLQVIPLLHLQRHQHQRMVVQLLINRIQLLFAGCLNQYRHGYIITIFAGSGFDFLTVNHLAMTADYFQYQQIEFQIRLAHCLNWKLAGEFKKSFFFHN